MIVPQFWAEGRVQHREKGRQVTVRRFGWSDNSQDEAQTLADQRAAEGLKRILSGQSVLRREPKMPYNGADGVPIREEIVSRHGDVIITRNSYGARCLNTPNVLFVDIDYRTAPTFRFTLGVFAVLLLAAFVVRLVTHSMPATLAVVVAALVLAGPISSIIHAHWLKGVGGIEGLARRRIADFLKTHPDWNLRLYRTPAGLRVLVMHRTFSPGEPAVSECFTLLGSDRIYSRMCRNQKCFRARVSPKPWRIGISQHLKPRPGTWPVHPDRLPLRRRWIEEYEKAARNFASCSFAESLGSGMVDPAARVVQELHDELSQAACGLPSA